MKLRPSPAHFIRPRGREPSRRRLGLKLPLGVDGSGLDAL